MSAPGPIERLYPLTPAVYRILDTEAGYPLRALLSVLEDEYRVIDADVDALYDDWFIETCAPWLVPYIGELVGVRDALDPGAIPTVRARVANALGYARRKGAGWVLARVARDVTGWQARVVEYFELLSQTQDVSVVRPARGTTADLRATRVLAAGTPFDDMAHTVEVRTAPDGGRWSPLAVGLFLWRLSSYPVAGTTPRSAGAGRYTFDPFGADTPLFVPPATLEPFGTEPLPWEVPEPLTVELLRLALAEERGDHDPWRASRYRTVAVWAGDDAASARRCRVVPADLGAWECAWVTPAERGVPRVAVDPARGRLAFPGGNDPAWVRAEWSYGFAADLGGGPYARGAAPAPADAAGAWTAWVGNAAGEAVPDGAVTFGTLAEALDAWSRVAGADGLIRLGDSATHALPAGNGWVAVPPGRRLWLVAAEGERPCLRGDLRLEGGDRAGAELDGVLVDGTVRLRGNLELAVRHCTLLPPLDDAPLDARPALAGDPAYTGAVRVARSIVGPLSLPAAAAGIGVFDSIVAGGVYALRAGTDDADASAGPDATIERCTVFGMVRTYSLTARDSIFTDLLWVEDTSTGSLTCCYAPPSGQMPPRDRCQPASGASADEARPVFTARRYGDAGFAQLASTCPESIRKGATNGWEMGAFHLLAEPRRTANLREVIDQFLPNGLDVVVSYVT